MTSSTVQDDTRRALLAAITVCAAAIVPYLSTLDDYFVRDDFGVVQLLAQKPASYFPRWFVTSWMDHIWGFLPDEVRPFTAVSYQITTLGGAASPVLHHILNILIHAANGVLVVALARTAAGLRLQAATLAGIVFVLFPVHAESVAWITGRVDSLPTFFYLASFLAYVRSASGPSPRRDYVWALVLFFAALFSKQNTITMVGTLALYDVLVARRPVLPVIPFVRPYVPFVVMTIGYLWLRYALFGQVARESALTPQGIEDFRVTAGRHLAHVVTGTPEASQGFAWAIVLTIAGLCRPVTSFRTLLYFGPLWWAIGIAPVIVAGYSSPRHVYLAAVGWAILLGLAFQTLWHARTRAVRRWATWAFAALAVTSYSVLLHASVREWNVIAAVSQKAVRDVRRAAQSAPQGSLLVVGAPVRSWEWALPFSVRPPFTDSDLTNRVFIVSPHRLSCCSLQWFDETRRTLRAWSAGPNRDAALALRWDAETGTLFRASEKESPQLPVVARALAEMSTAREVDTNLIRMLESLTR